MEHLPNQGEMGAFERWVLESNLTRGQLLIYLGQCLAPNSPLYNMALAFEIGGQVDEPRLADAIRRVITQCDALQTVFNVVDGVPQQFVRDNIDATVELIDFTKQSAPMETARSWMRERARRVLPLGEPPFETALLRVAEDSLIWYLNQHHLITDAWGASVIYERVAEAYQSAEDGREISAPPPPFAAYRDYEKQADHSEYFADGQNHWSRYRDSVVDFPSPLYGKENSTGSTRTRRLTRRLRRETVAQLKVLAARPDVRSFTRSPVDVHRVRRCDVVLAAAYQRPKAAHDWHASAQPPRSPTQGDCRFLY